MRFRRGIVSYILWALYGLAVCAALTLQIRTTGLFFLWEETLWYLPAAAGCVLLLFAAVFLPARLISRKAAGRAFADKKRKEPGREKKRRRYEQLYVVFLIAASMALRLGSMEGGFPAMDGNVQGQAVSAGFPFASLTWTTLEAWIGILLSALPGGTVTAGIGRCLYESAGIFLFYAALRILAGRISAVTVTAVLALQPLFPAFCEDGGLFLTAAGLLLLAAALYLKKLSWGKAIPAGRAVFCGLTAGAAFFLDPAFLSFLILPVWASAFVCGAGRAGRRAVGMLLVCLSATVGFFGLAALACVFLQENPAALSLWLSAAGGKLSAAASLPSLNAAWNPVFFFLCCLCVLYIFGFFDQKGNAGSVWLPSFLLSLLFVPGAGQKELPALLFWLIFAGMGIHGAFLCSGKKKAGNCREAGGCGKTGGCRETGCCGKTASGSASGKRLFGAAFRNAASRGPSSEPSARPQKACAQTDGLCL